MGLNIIIVGLASETNALKVSPLEQVSDYYNYDNLDLLLQNPTMARPPISYIAGDFESGWFEVAALGYVLSMGGSAQPTQSLDPRIFTRIPEFISRFSNDLKKNGFTVNPCEVGVYSLQCDE